ncbi:MAG: T9SS type A sorting domain-containing protein [Bacteroidia bacterium]|nr:T9SS type A sorting domain-containing protein [Bacteroidia bacterium]
MKLFSIIICMVFSSYLAIGQPMINSSVIFDLGESSEVEIVQDFYAPGASGPNVSWDFSNISGPSFRFDWRAINPDTLPIQMQDSFPNSDLSFLTPIGDTIGNYLFYRESNDSLFLLGAALTRIPTGDTTWFMLNEDPQLSLAFPISYEDVQTDSFAGTNWVQVQGNLFMQKRRGSITHTADAYGDITTPLGTFNNALRIKTEERVYDTLVVMGFPASTSIQEITRYAWYVEGEKYLIMQMDSISTSPGTLTKQAQYRTEALATAIDPEILSKMIDFRLFPNPANKAIRLSFQLPQRAPVQIEILNMMGQKILLKEYAEIASFEDELSIDQLPQGSYLLRVFTPLGSISKPLLIN